MNQIYQTMIAATPIASSLICITFLLSTYGDRLLPVEKTIKRLLLLYFCQIIFNWLFNSLIPIPNVIVQYLLPFIALNLHLVQVTYFHVICILASMDEGKRKLPAYHYIIPFLLCIVACIFFYSSLSFFPSQRDAYVFFRPYLFISVTIYSVFYDLLMTRAILQNRRRLIDENRIEDWKRISWLSYIVMFRVFLLIVYICLYAFAFYKSLLYAIFIPVFHLVLIYNLLQRNYVFRRSYIEINKALQSSGRIVTSYNLVTSENDVVVAVKNKQESANLLLLQSDIDSYFRLKKPYLDPGLKMDDVIKEFGTNRAYFSKFVNQAFGVSFSNYVNLWRLKELDLLLKEEDGKEKNLQSLVAMVGFGSLRNYWRVKKRLEGKSDIIQ